MVINSGEGIKPIFKPHVNRCNIVKCYMLMELCKILANNSQHFFCSVIAEV